MKELGLTVTNLSGTAANRPVTGGVALPKGAAPVGAQFALHDGAGTFVTCQTATLATWEDGSARWVILDFQSAPEPRQRKDYRLGWDASTRQPTPEVPVHITAGPDFLLESGSLQIRPAEDALFSICNKADVALTAEDGEGRRCRAVAESVEIETQGNVRSVLCFKGALRTETGERFLGFRMWVSVFAGLGKIKMEPMILADPDRGMINKLRELKLEIRTEKPVDSAVLGGDRNWQGRPTPGLRLFQVDDQQYRIEGATGSGSKAPGWAELTSSGWRMSAAVRDFWQQWPKSLEITGSSLGIGLFPRFTEGEFDHMLDPWYKHDYLFEGDCYRLRTGQVRRWQVWLDVEGDGAALAECANYPLVPASDPVAAMSTGLWGDVAPAGAPGMAEYDTWAAALFDSYHNSIAAQRDYGAMNWGDWFGERGCNWGNHEYDTPRQMMVQFARTGNPQYFHTGDTAARHMSEVDVVHFITPELKQYFETETPCPKGAVTEPGLVHEHSVGHVGGFHSVQTIRELYIKLRVGNTDRPYLCIDPYNLGHIFTQGMMYTYFLTGDPWIKETLDKIGSLLAKLVERRERQFRGHSHCGRENGWTVLALSACYELEHDQRYLNAMKTLVDDAISEQDSNCGGWLYKLGQGHCDCVTNKHVGEATFIAAIRLNGLYSYYRLTGDERIPEAIRRGIAHLSRDTWNPEAHGWRYTSCPQTFKSVTQSGVIIQAVSGSIRATNDEEQLAMLPKAWNRLFERLKSSPKIGGKSFSSTLYGCPETASLLAEKPQDHT